ncbi:MAG: M16 family metallopeptidase [Armatimonadota bacterium]
MRKLTLALFILLLATACLAAQGPQKVTLENGLTIVVEEDHSAPVATVQFFIGTGSSLEDQYLGSGISHLIEHMLFEGTATRTGADLERERAELGNNSNAYTSKSVVSYYMVTSGTLVNKAIDMVADYVFNPTFPEQSVITQKGIIERENARGKDEPGRRIYNLFAATMFRVSPEGVPVIGHLDQFRELQREDLVALHSRFYVPSNVVATVVGDFNGDAVMAHLKQLLEKVPARAYRAPVLPEEPIQLAPRRAVEEDPALSRAYLMLGYRTVSMYDADMYPLDVLAYILGNGDASRLVSKLRDDLGLVDGISAMSSTPTYDAGFFGVSAVTDPAKAAAAETPILAEIVRVKNQLVTPEELARAKRQKEADLLFARVTTQGRATMYGNDLLTTGDLNFSEKYVERIRQVTAADIQRVACKYFRTDHYTVAVLRPPLAASQPAAAPAAAKPAGRGVSAASGAIQEVKLQNGVTLLVQENPAVPVTNLFIAFRGGLVFETAENAGISSLMSSMLVRGTKTRDRLRIARALEDVGGSLGPYSGRNSFGIAAQVRSQDLPLAMEIAADVLRNPTFPEAELQQQKQLQLAALSRREDDVDTFATDLMLKTLFVNYPYRFPTPGTRESVTALTRQDLISFHQRLARPNNMVISVFGDTSLAQAQALVQRYFGNLQPQQIVPPQRPAEPPVDTTRKQEVTRPQQQAVVIYGFQGPKIADPDRYARDVMSAVFAGLGYPGGRLHEALRGQQLVYATFGFAAPGPETGYFEIYAGTAPEKAAAVQEQIEKLVRDLQAAPPTAEELALAKSVAISTQAVQLESSASRAQSAALDVLNGLGRNEMFRYAAEIAKVTPEQVQEQARKLMPLDRKVLVITKPAGQ